MAKKEQNGEVKRDGPIGLGKVKSIEDVKAETLVGDVRDLLLQEARDAKEGLPWTLRGEKDQREVVDRLDRFSRTIIARAVELVAASGARNTIPGQIKQWRVKDGVQIQVDAPECTETILSLCDGGRQVRLVFADPEAFAGERSAITPAPDQRRLNLDDGDGGPIPPPKPPGGPGKDDGPTFDGTDAGRRG